MDQIAVPKDIEIIDPLGDDDTVDVSPYQITSFGADYPVDALVSRLERGDIFTPNFQRDYVWSQRTASRFIESLLLGLPVPGIFLSVDAGSNQYLIIDGQQRLKTLQYYFRGIFEPMGKRFSLVGVQPDFRGLSYSQLSPFDQRKLGNSIIHATIIQQDNPRDDSSSIYHIFERLNTGGKQLAPQEIRSALFAGPLTNLLSDLNQIPEWRAIYGPVSPQQRDIELIVRFFAFLFHEEDYKALMKGFLNRFMARHRLLDDFSPSRLTDQFSTMVCAIDVSLGIKAFKPKRALNAAVFDSVSVAIARRLKRGPIVDLLGLQSTYDRLLVDGEFEAGIVRATANEVRVRQRFSVATSMMDSVV